MPEPSPHAEGGASAWLVSVHSPDSLEATLTVESARDGTRTGFAVRVGAVEVAQVDQRPLDHEHVGFSAKE